MGCRAEAHASPQDDPPLKRTRRCLGKGAVGGMLIVGGGMGIAGLTIRGPGWRCSRPRGVGAAFLGVVRGRPHGGQIRFLFARVECRFGLGQESVPSSAPSCSWPPAVDWITISTVDRPSEAAAYGDSGHRLRGDIGHQDHDARRATIVGASLNGGVPARAGRGPAAVQSERHGCMTAPIAAIALTSGRVRPRCADSARHQYPESAPAANTKDRLGVPEISARRRDRRLGQRPSAISAGHFDRLEAGSSCTDVLGAGRGRARAAA